MQILPGCVTAIGYRPNLFGPPGGSFERFEVEADRALALADFARMRDEGRLERWVLDRGAPGPITPAAWYPDPLDRHELRYWDGRSWTSFVADGQQTGTDPTG